MNPLALLSRNSDVALALGVIGILAVMVVPLPTLVLDLLLTLNLGLSLVILVVAMYLLNPLQFSSFPSFLLLATLFRLSLNVASSRLVLLHGSEGPGAAGMVIKAFGSVVVGGNYIVGMVLFLILVVINFVVITKGAGRIAEVAARFTLDAMPGKQMAIDADLNAGLINDVEARRRRLAIQKEADFYGAMDGASKFVRGDAVAGIIIVVINIVGGFLIGVLQQGMELADAATTYTLLTVGDGLVTQIPALIVSTAAGIVVTRAASEGNLGAEMSRQILVHPRAIGVAAAVLLLLGVVPGLPLVPFVTLGLVAGGISYAAGRAQTAAAPQPEPQEAKPAPPERQEVIQPLDLLELELGYGLIPLVDPEQHGELLERIKGIRRQYAQELGLIIPSIHVRDNLQLKPAQYAVLIKGVEVTRGEVMLNHLLAMNAGLAQDQLEGIPTREPAFGLPALWITDQDRERAQLLGYTVVDLATVITTHLGEVVRAHAHELLDRQQTQTLLDHLAKVFPKVVEELVPNLLSLGGVQKVLQNLLRERVSIRDLLTILEVLADYAPMTKDPEILTEQARQALARTITRQVRGPDGEVPVIVLDPQLEQAVAQAIHRTEHGAYLALEPGMVQHLLTQLGQAAARAAAVTEQPALLCSPVIRPHVRRLIERQLPQLAVLSPSEITPEAKLHTLATIGLHHAGQTV